MPEGKAGTEFLQEALQGVREAGNGVREQLDRVDSVYLLAVGTAKAIERWRVRTRDVRRTDTLTHKLASSRL